MRYIILIFLASIIGILHSCIYDKVEPEGYVSDETLFSLSDTTVTNFQYYKNNLSILSAAGNSPHGAFRVRFDSIAASALDTNGVLPSGATFPNNSVIVKETYIGSKIDLIVLMYKSAGAPNANLNWVWGEYNTDGSVVYSSGKAGTDCVSCHSDPGNKDYVRLFGEHP